MPQLAPVNWLFLFILFWFVIALTSALIWWSFKPEYKLSSPTATSISSSFISKPWTW